MCCSVLQNATFCCICVFCFYFYLSQQGPHFARLFFRVFSRLECIEAFCSVLQCVAVCCSVLQRCHSPNWEICQFVTAISHAISVTQTNMNHVESSIYFSNRFKKKYIFKCMSMCLSTPRWVCEYVDPWSHSFGVTAQECVRSKCDFSILGRVMFAGIYDIRLHPLLSVEETRRKALIPKHFTM